MKNKMIATQKLPVNCISDRQIHYELEWVAKPSVMTARCVDGNSCPIFSICGPQFAKLGMHVQEISQFATSFAICRYLRETEKT